MADGFELEPDDGDMLLDASSPAGLVTQSPFAFAALLVALYWIVKLIRPVDSSRPPRAPSWIPWIGPVVEMGKDPDAFFRNMESLLGPIFRLKTLGTEMIYVTSPTLISQVYRDSKNFDITNIRIDIGQKLFFVDPRIVSDSYMIDRYMPAFHHLMLPNNLGPITSAYLASVHDALLGMISSTDGASGPLKTFIIPPAYRAAAHATFGADFPAEASYPFFKKFDEGLPLLNTPIPRFLLKSTVAAWDNLVALVEKYVAEQQEKGEELTEFVQVAVNGIRADNWTTRDVATILGSQLWALQANAVFTAYWLIALCLDQPEGLGPIVEELDNARHRWQATHHTTSVGLAFFEEVGTSSKALPLLNSALQEVLRYTTSSFSMRQVTENTELGGYQVKEGERVVCVTRNVHIDDEVHPQATHLNLRRYLEAPRATKDGKVVANHTMSFGGGVSMCEGRHFAMTELRMFVAVLLTYATLEIDEGCTTRPVLMSERIGLGVIHPRGDVDIIMRKRKL